jgi:hypothetical protein
MGAKCQGSGSTSATAMANKVEGMTPVALAVFKPPPVAEYRAKHSEGPPGLPGSSLPHWDTPYMSMYALAMSCQSSRVRFSCRDCNSKSIGNSGSSASSCSSSIW